MWICCTLMTSAVGFELAVLSQDSVVLEKQWYVNGQNYSKTVQAWLRHHDQQRKAILCLLQVGLDRRCIAVACVLLLWLSSPLNQCIAKQQGMHVKQDSCLHCRKAMGWARATSCLPNDVLHIWSSVSSIDMLAEQNGVLRTISFAMWSHNIVMGSVQADRKKYRITNESGVCSWDHVMRCFVQLVDFHCKKHCTTSTFWCQPLLLNDQYQKQYSGTVCRDTLTCTY